MGANSLDAGGRHSRITLDLYYRARTVVGPRKMWNDVSQRRFSVCESRCLTTAITRKLARFTPLVPMRLPPMRCDARRESFLGAEWSPQAHPIGESPSTLGILARVHRSLNSRVTVAVSDGRPGNSISSYIRICRASRSGRVSCRRSERAWTGERQPGRCGYLVGRCSRRGRNWLQ